MYFWKSQFIPKDLQEHIAKTIARVKGNRYPVNAAEEVKEFLEKTETILSSSNEQK